MCILSHKNTRCKFTMTLSEEENVAGMSSFKREKIQLWDRHSIVNNNEPNSLWPSAFLNTILFVVLCQSLRSMKLNKNYLSSVTTASWKSNIPPICVTKSKLFPFFFLYPKLTHSCNRREAYLGENAIQMNSNWSGHTAVRTPKNCFLLSDILTARKKTRS